MELDPSRNEIADDISLQFSDGKRSLEPLIESILHLLLNIVAAHLGSRQAHNKNSTPQDRREGDLKGSPNGLGERSP